MSMQTTASIIEREVTKDMNESRPEPNTSQVRRIGREVAFRLITEQMPHLARSVRRELSKVYESEQWKKNHG